MRPKQKNFKKPSLKITQILPLLITKTLQILTSKEYELPEFITKSSITRIDLGYFIDFSQADLPSLKFSNPPSIGYVTNTSFSSIDLQLSMNLISSTVLKFEKLKVPDHDLLITAFDPVKKICYENYVEKNYTINQTVYEQMEKMQCAALTTRKFEMNKTSGERIWRFYSNQSNLLLIDDNFQIFNSTAELSDMIRLDGSQLFSVLTPDADENLIDIKKSQNDDDCYSLIYQKNRDINKKFKEDNFLILNSGEIKFRIPIVDTQFCDTCSPIWVNYVNADSYYGFIWVIVGFCSSSHPSDPCQNYVQFYKMEREYSKSKYYFNFTNIQIGYVGLVGNNSKYMEIDGKGNTAKVCDFSTLSVYDKYSDFEVNCYQRDIEINLEEDEYIFEAYYGEDHSILVDIYNMTDLTKSRSAWSYNYSIIKPKIDFENQKYIIQGGSRWALNTSLSDSQDLLVSKYPPGSTNFYLIGENSKRKSDKLRISQILEASDKDNKVIITLSYEETDEFFPFNVGRFPSNLNYDQLSTKFEYSRKSIQVTGDEITISPYRTLNGSYITASPITVTQDFRVKPNKGRDVNPPIAGFTPPDLILNSTEFDIYKSNDLLSRLCLKPNPSVMNNGSPYVAEIDLKYLGIYIDKFISNGVFKILIIKNKNLEQKKYTVMKFHSNSSYEVRKFDGDIMDDFDFNSRNFLFNKESSDISSTYFFKPVESQIEDNGKAFKLDFRCVIPQISMVEEPYPTTFSKVTLNNKAFSLNLQRIHGYDNATAELKTKIPIDINKEIFEVNLKEFLAISGNSFYVDESISTKRNQEFEPMSLRDLEYTPFTPETPKFYNLHSLTQTDYPSQNFQIINYIGLFSDCQIGSYEVYQNKSLVSGRIYLDQDYYVISSFFSLGPETGYITYLMALYTGELLVDVIYLGNSQNQDPFKRMRFPMLPSKKVRILQNNMIEETSIIVRLTFDEDVTIHQLSTQISQLTPICHLTPLTTPVDFEILNFPNSYHLFIILITKSSGVEILAYEKSTYNREENINYKLLTEKLPNSENFNNLRCKVISDEYEFECTIHSDEFKMYNFRGQFDLILKPDVSVNLQNVEVYDYFTPFYDELVNCETSENFINCESALVVQNENPFIKTNNSENFLITWPKINGDFKGDSYSSRIKKLPIEQLCTNKNFRVENYTSDQIITVEMNQIDLLVFFEIRSIVLKDEIALKFNLTDFNTKEIINNTKVNIYLNPRFPTSVFVIGGDDEFDLQDSKKNENWFLEWSFVFFGIVIGVIIIAGVVQAVKKEADDESEYKEIIIEEEGIQDLEDEEFGGGLRYQDDLEFGGAVEEQEDEGDVIVVMGE